MTPKNEREPYGGDPLPSMAMEETAEPPLGCDSESPEPSTYCTFQLGHEGRCSWEKDDFENDLTAAFEATQPHVQGCCCPECACAQSKPEPQLSAQEPRCPMCCKPVFSEGLSAQEAAREIVTLLEKRIDEIQEGEPAIDLLRVSEVEQIIRKAKP